MELSRDQIPADLMEFFEPAQPCGGCYVCRLVDVFREVRRVLRPDGTLWLNLGDSYAGANAMGRAGSKLSGLREAGAGFRGHDRNYEDGPRAAFGGLKHKDLVGIPWRVAFALQADGWYLRSDIVWAKPNPMPESVTDRPTKAHEYVFLLAKSARYYYDADAVREAPAESVVTRAAYMVGGRKYDESRNDADMGTRKSFSDYLGGRNLRSVWTIATAPYPGAHFATFPPRLVEPCVKAGTSERGVCPECGAPWTRVVEKGELRPVRGEYLGPIEDGAKLDGRAGFHGAGKGGMVRTTEGWSFLKRDRSTTAWEPSCRCNDDPYLEHGPGDGSPVPATVLDPFAGTGTVGLVAQSLSRRAVLIDLNAEYLVQCLGRNRQVPLGLGS